jgi:uncharacterized membrane protein YfcA
VIGLLLAAAPAEGAAGGGGLLTGALGPEVSFSIAGAALIGLGVGFLSGLLGVGGGFLLAPLLNGILGVPFRIAGPSDLCQIQGTSLSGLLRHRKLGSMDAQVAVLLLGGTFCGSFVGVRIMSYLKSLGSVELGGGRCAVVEVVLIFLFVLMLLIIGSSVLAESIRSGRRARESDGAARGPRRGLFARIRIPPYVTPVGGSPVPAVMVAYAGVVVGLLQALLGIGGGVLLLPILVYFVGVGTHAAVGTSLMIVFGASILGTLFHALDGNISLPLVCALLVGGTLGSQWGAMVSAKVASHKLRRFFALLVLTALVIVAGKTFRIFGLISWWPGH